MASSISNDNRGLKGISTHDIRRQFATNSIPTNYGGVLFCLSKTQKNDNQTILSVQK